MILTDKSALRLGDKNIQLKVVRHTEGVFSNGKIPKYGFSTTPQIYFKLTHMYVWSPVK